MPAAKLLSCIYRVRAHSGYATGAHHLIDVLLGHVTENVTARGHDRLSTFGVGTEFTKTEWLALVSEMLRLGWIDQDPERRTLNLTHEGRNALKERRPFAFAKPRIVGRPAKGRKKTSRGDVDAVPFESALFEDLRRLRKRLAEEQGVPPYVVFSDATLRELAARKPATLTAFRDISGVGDVKLERYGESFVQAIAAFGR